MDAKRALGRRYVLHLEQPRRARLAAPGLAPPPAAGAARRAAAPAAQLRAHGAQTNRDGRSEASHRCRCSNLGKLAAYERLPLPPPHRVSQPAADAQALPAAGKLTSAVTATPPSCLLQGRARLRLGPRAGR